MNLRPTLWRRAGPKQTRLGKVSNKHKLQLKLPAGQISVPTYIAPCVCVCLDFRVRDFWVMFRRSHLRHLKGTGNGIIIFGRPWKVI